MAVLIQPSEHDAAQHARSSIICAFSYLHSSEYYTVLGFGCVQSMHLVVSSPVLSLCLLVTVDSPLVFRSTAVYATEPVIDSRVVQPLLQFRSSDDGNDDQDSDDNASSLGSACWIWLRQQQPCDVLLTFESSSQWPDNDLRAIATVKTAFYIRIAQVLHARYNALWLGQPDDSNGGASDPDAGQATAAAASGAHQSRRAARAAAFARRKAQKMKQSSSSSSAGAAAATGALAQLLGSGSETLASAQIAVQVAMDWCDVLIDGCVFRVRIVYDRELVVIRSLASGILLCI